MKKWSALLLVFLLSLAVFSGCGVSEKTEKVHIGFQVIPNTEALVKANGWLEKNLKNADVEWLQFDSGRDVNTALASGKIDIGLLGSTLIANGLSKGLDYKVIWIADVIGENEALAVKDSSNISSMEDLKGKTIAVTFGSTTQYSLLEALKLYGLSEKDVNIIDMQPADMLAAWQRGDIDGGFVWHPTLQQMLDNGGKVLVDSGTLSKEGIITADVIVARTAFIKEHPELIQQYIEAQLDAVAEFRNDKSKAAGAVAKEFAITEDAALTMMEQLIWLSGKEHTSADYLGTKDQIGNFANVLENTAQFLKTQGIIDVVPESSTFKNAIMPEFIEKAINQGKE